MRMNIRCAWRSFATIGVALATFGAAPAAMAIIIGSATLDITQGAFSYYSQAAVDNTPYELVTGDFAYTNTLPADINASYHYQGSATVNVNGGASGAGQTFSRSKDFGYTSLNSIMVTPDGQAALGLVNMFAGATTGSSTFGGYQFSWNYTITSPTSTGGSGNFSLWSMVDYSGNANPGGLVFPATASFNAHMAFNASSKVNSVPEPGTLWLMGLGLLAVAGLRGKTKSA